MLDLQPFCGREETRPYLMKPFSRGGFTYATDGIIMVRVTLRADVPDVDQKLNQDRPLQGIETVAFFLPSFELPTAPTERGECPVCDGRGFEHECPDCKCICIACKGEGDLDLERRASVNVGPTIFNLHYVRMMLSLPGIELAELPSKANEGPLLFRFDEGVGALMPMRSGHQNHIDIHLRAADKAIA